MSNLTEIKNRFLQMLDIVQQAEHAAQGDVDEIEDRLYTELDEAIADVEHKFESCAIVIDNLKAGARVARERAQAWTDHRRHIENNIARLTQWVEGNLMDIPSQKIETLNYKLSMVNNPPRVEVDEYMFELWASENKNSSLVKYYETFTPVKKEIKSAIQNGQEVPGCVLIEGGKRLKIK